MIAFKAIRARAAKRKGGEAALASLLPKVPSQKALARVTDDRVLAEMSKRIFSAGFVWSVIEKKWPGFEAAFLEFDPRKLNFQPDEFWEGLAGDQRRERGAERTHQARLRFPRDSHRQRDRPARRRQEPGPGHDAARGRTRVPPPTPVAGHDGTLTLTVGPSLVGSHKLGAGRGAAAGRTGSAVAPSWAIA